MRGRQRALAALLVCILHLAVFAPRVGEWSSVLVNDFAPQAEAIESGDRPYGDQDLGARRSRSCRCRLRPCSRDGTDGYVEAFHWEMIIFDLAIVLLLALALPGRSREVISALAVYTAGVLLLSGVILDDSAIDQSPLALSRFDLVPAFLVLAAVLARDAAPLGDLVGTALSGTMVKAFPALLYPALLRGERRSGSPSPPRFPAHRRRRRGRLGRPLSFSAITYHRTRAPDRASHRPRSKWRASSGRGDPVPGHGGFDLVASGAGVAKWIWVLLGIGVYLMVVRAGWRSRISNLRLVTALLAVLVVFATVLSPQFLLWLLPLSAAAYGLGRENIALLVSVILTQVMLGLVRPWTGVRRRLRLATGGSERHPCCLPGWSASRSSGPGSETGDAGLSDPAALAPSFSPPLALRLVVVQVDLRELRLLGGLVLGEAGVDRAGLDAGVAVDALVGIDVELLDALVIGLDQGRVDAVDGADLDARELSLVPMQGSAMTYATALDPFRSSVRGRGATWGAAGATF